MRQRARLMGFLLALTLFPAQATSSAEPPLLGQLQHFDPWAGGPFHLAHAVQVYLPPAYGSGDTRYPVLYVQEGAPLDAGTHGWSVARVAEQLAREGVQVIIVGVHGTVGNSDLSGESATYLAELVQHIKPWVDANYRTKPGAKHTGIAGTGSAGLLGVMAGLHYPQVFGFVGALSPNPGVNDRAVLKRAWQAKPVGQAFFLSVNTSEGPTEEASLARVMDTSELAWALRMNGARVGYVETPAGAVPAEDWKAGFTQVLRSFQLYAKN